MTVQTAAIPFERAVPREGSVVQGFEQLSDESCYRRFLHHPLDPHGTEPVGVARYVRLDDRESAEVAISIGAWFAILFTWRYPRSLFDFVERVLRRHNRVVAYTFVLLTDEYPPFRPQP
jgi:hypothetical protein